LHASNFLVLTRIFLTHRTCVTTGVKMSAAAIVAASVGAFVATGCIKLLKAFAIRKGWYPSPPGQSTPHDETMVVLGEVRDVLVDINQGIGRLEKLGEARLRDGEESISPVPGAAAHPADG
jgi:hypothetical protein